MTALAFFKQDYILAGEGTYLRVYGPDSSLLKSLSIFEGQAIHGIIVDERHEESSPLLVWGGSLSRPVVLDLLQSGEIDLTLGEAVNGGDCILDAAFRPDEKENSVPTVASITAHNAFSTTQITFDELYDDKPSTALNYLLSGSNCMLYSAHISWLSVSQCLIASGTAFGDVIVWSATLDETKKGILARCQTHYTFSAHEGSVFGVRISPELSITNFKCSRALATCSDDRTIRIWDISDLSRESPTLQEIQRETGFGAKPNDGNNAPRYLAKVMGHVSRIWHVRYRLDRDDDAVLNVLSFGEDATVIEWAFKSSDSQSMQFPYVLEQLKSNTAHSGKNIWSVAVDELDSANLATGGADGSIVRRSLAKDLYSQLEVPRILLEDVDGDDNYKAYDFIDSDILFATTNRGRIVLVDLSSAYDAVGVSEISEAIPGLKGYSVVACVPGIAFVSGSDGMIYSFSQQLQFTHALSKIAECSGKTAGLFACQFGEDGVALLVASVGGTRAQLFTLENRQGAKGLEASSYKKQWLSLAPGCIVTSFAYYMDKGMEFAALGARDGDLAVFDLSPSEPCCAQQCTSKKWKDAVTSLQFLHAYDNLWLYSTSRDGTYAVQRIRFDPVYDIELTHRLSLPFGPNIEGLSIFPNCHLLVWGFKSKHFIAYDATAQEESVVVECGGAHRNWAFQPSTRHFVWTKASQVSEDRPHQISRRINAGGHGREIKATAVSSGQPQLIATGAEDTNIKIFRLEGEVFTCLSTLRMHNTGIQHLQWSPDGQYLFSSGGFEEFFIWKIRPYVPCVGIGVLCQSKHPQSGSSDLRIMGFDASVGTSRNPNDLLKCFIIHMAYSDSTMKIWRYLDRQWELLASADYLTSCLTHVWPTDDKQNVFYTAASDGHLVRWRFDRESQQLSWLNRHKVHQSAMHEIVDVSDLRDGSRIVVSGGDDNAIGITRIDTSGSIRTLLIPRAHAAPVTGLAIMSLEKGNLTYWLASASIDQRVKFWKMDVDATQPGVDGVIIRRVRNVFTTVADVSSLELCKLEDGPMGLLVCGVGMDLWRLPAASENVIGN